MHIYIHTNIVIYPMHKSWRIYEMLLCHVKAQVAENQNEKS